MTMTDQPAVPCNAAQLHRFGDLQSAHGPHKWVVQPGMDPVRCPGAGEQAAARLLDCGLDYEENGEEVHPHPECPIGQAAVPAVQAPAADRATLRDRIAEALRAAACNGDCDDTEEECARKRVQPYVWQRGVLTEILGTPEVIADAVLAVLPAPTDRAADAPAAECSAQNRNYESGPRQCIRAAQHHGDHIDENGFHWSDSVAVYPLADGTFRTGVDRAALRRMADEAQP
jgi:hypothetical protein